ncbi:MAG: DUF3108 domain-containing protein [Magnetococcales bacterium]|nr:DUF3108 domain-containing protein [Magnetococcales bacterium]
MKNLESSTGKKRNHTVVVAWLLIMVSLFSVSRETMAEVPSSAGPQPGEALTFKVSWSGISSGKAVMRADKVGNERYSFSIHLRSSGLVETFYPVNDYLIAEGVWSQKGLNALSFTKKQSEGGRKRLTEYAFQREKEAVVRRLNQGEPEYLESVPSQVNDPVTALYLLRFQQDLTPASTINISVMGSREWHHTPVEVGDVQMLEVAAGQFQAFPVSLDLGLFNKRKGNGRTTVWLSDDLRRLPILVKSKVSIGTMEFELTEISEGTGSWLTEGMSN